MVKVKVDINKELQQKNEKIVQELEKGNEINIRMTPSGVKILALKVNTV